MAPSRHAPPRLLLLACVLATCMGLAGGLRADDPPAPGPPALPDLFLAPVETDPRGVLEVLLRGAEQHRAARSWGRLAERLAAVMRAGADVPVALPVGDLEREALRWPAARVVELLAAELPADVRAALARQVHGATPELDAERALRGDAQALERLARAPVLHAAGEEALLAEGELALERGASEVAATFFRRWLELHRLAGHASRLAPRRAEVALRLVSALARAGDEAGLRALALEPAGEPAATGGGPRPSRVGEQARRRLALLLDSRTPPSRSPSLTLPTQLVELWGRDLSDPGLRGASAARELVTEGLWAEPDLLLVHAGRRVSRLDPLTGRERWSFPPGPLGWDHDPDVKYEPHDLPLRSVERRGGLVLAVLGDPGGSGSFELGEAQLDLDGGTRESRARLVALDSESGELRWHTGALAERHPILGDRATCCTSPPLVVGDDVYVLFARRFGVVDLYAACLELATGRPRWVRFLGAAESGRDLGAEPLGGRQDRPPVRAVPWGQRPALAQGELCVVPHAGFAAGLEPTTGTLRWLRALPRFAPGSGARDRSVGASARNEPLALPGAWALAPMDAPVVLALEHGSGRLRWHTPSPAPELAPPWRDLLGLARDVRGTPVLRLVGAAPAHLDPLSGALLEQGRLLNDDGLEGRPLAVRALDLGDGVAALRAGRLVARAWPGAAGAAPAEVELVPRGQQESELADADLARAGPVWLVLEPGRLSAWIDPREAQGLLGAAARERVIEPGARAALEVTAAGVLDDAPLLAAALGRLDDQTPVPAVMARALCRYLAARSEPSELLRLLQQLGPHLARLPAPERDRAFALGSVLLRRWGRVDELVDLLGRWIDAPPGLLRVPLPWSPDVRDWLPSAPAWPTARLPDDEPRVRGDLLAALTLRSLRDTPPALEALARREALVAARWKSALAQPDPIVLEEALRSAAGTRVVASAREQLIERALAAGDPGRAARLAADLRLDPPEQQAGREPAARVWAARWQLAEAGWLAEAGDIEAARTLLEDLRRWVPSGTQDTRGRTTSTLLDELRATHGWSPRRGGDAHPALVLWPAGPRPASRDERASITIPTIEGPGAWRPSERLLIVRGLSLELWAPVSGERVAVLDAGDQGWFGGTLQDGAPWLPERGVRVVSAVAGEPADRAGLRAGDWIMGWGGRPVGGTSDLMLRIASSPPAQPVALELVRTGARLSLSMRPGRRPPQEALGVVLRERLWADPQGRLLLPTRLGLSRLDLDAARLEGFWRWEGPGTVLRAEVHAGLSLAVIRRVHQDDLLVALDVRDGRERWRASIRGTVRGLAASGSALVVSTESPARVLVLGADDGLPRADLPRREIRRSRYPVVLPPPLTAEAAAGRLYLLRPGEGAAALEVVNTTTGRTASAPVEPVRGSSALEPSLSAGAYVALLLGPTLVRVYEPDPLDEGFTRAVRLQAGDLLTEQAHHGGELDSESRLVTRGDTLYVLRYQRRREGSQERGATVMTLGRIDGSPRLRFGLLDVEPPVSRATGELYVTHLETHADGLLVSAQTQSPDARGEHLRSVLWVPSAEGGSAERPSSPPVWEDGITSMRRSGPARVGPYLVLPTDDGARLVPVVRITQR